MLTIIAAISDNNVIGYKGKIPWDIPEDRIRFRKLTLNHPVIMGRKTFESIPFLDKRKNIVLSATLKEQPGICIARTLEDALELANGRDSFVIGGEQIYRMFLPIADKMEITRIHQYYDGDKFFPELDWNQWNLVNTELRNNPFEIKPPYYSFWSYVKK